MSPGEEVRGGTRATEDWVVVLDHASRTPDFRLLPGSGSSAPAVAETELCSVVFDGVLHERTELCRTVGERYRRDISDAALLLKAYLHLGVDLFPRLRGAFSLVIWDARHATLCCVRDPIGTYPLFYSPLGLEVALSQSIDALIHHNGVSPSVDRVAAASFIAQLPPRPEETLFSAIRRIPAGRLLRVCRGAFSLERYWTPEEAPLETGDEQELIDQFRVLLCRSVSRSLNGRPGSVFLSGGLDSAAVAATAAEVSREERLPAPRALSLAFPALEANEEPTQRLVAASLGLPHLVATPDQAVGSNRLLRSALALAGSTASPPGLLQPAYDFLALEARNDGCRVILTGDGGDEWLLVPPLYAADRLLSFDLPALYTLWSAWHRYWPGGTRWGAARSAIWSWGARPLIRGLVVKTLERWSPRTLRSGRIGRLTPWIPAWLAPDSGLRHDLLDSAVAHSPEAPPTRLYQEAKHELLESPGMSEHHEEAFATRRRLGVEILMPLLDADLVGFLNRVPPRLLLRRGRAKALAREILAPILPFAHTWPRTVYGEAIWTSAVRAEGRDAWRDMGGLKALSELEVVDEAAFAAQLRDGHASGIVSYDAMPSWHALCLESWLRTRILAE